MGRKRNSQLNRERDLRNANQPTSNGVAGFRKQWKELTKVNRKLYWLLNRQYGDLELVGVEYYGSALPDLSRHQAKNPKVRIIRDNDKTSHKYGMAVAFKANKRTTEQKQYNHNAEVYTLKRGDRTKRFLKLNLGEDKGTQLELSRFNFEHKDKYFCRKNKLGKNSGWIIALSDLREVKTGLLAYLNSQNAKLSTIFEEILSCQQ